MNIFDKLWYKYNTAAARAQASVENEDYWAAAVRNIAPVCLEEANNGKYVLINHETYAKCIIVGIPRDTINGYPQGLSENLITRLINLSSSDCAITISLKLIPVDPEEATKMIQKSIFLNRLNMDDSKKRNIGGIIDMNLTIDQEHNTANYRAIKENKERMFSSVFIIVFKAVSVEKLDIMESDVRSILQSEGPTYEFPYYRQKEIYLAAQPFNITPKYAKVEILSPYAAVLTTSRNPNSITDSQGLYFGMDRYTKKSILVDIDALAAQHLLGVGATGSGKTYTLLVLLLRAYSMLNRRVIYCTPKADITTNHRAVVEYLGDAAELIDIGPNGRNINPLQILYDRSVMKDNIVEYTHAYNVHKGILTKFFEVWFADTGTINMANFIDYSLNKVYENAGVYRNIPSSWHVAKWPVLSDLIDVWKDELKVADSDDKKTIKAILNKTYSLGQDGALEYLNRPTDIDVSKDFIVFDLSNTPDMIRDAMNVILTGVIGQRFRTDTTKKTIIAVDEARVFLQNPTLSKFLMTTLTQGRSAGIALWLLTQQATDLIKGNVAEEFQTNIFLKLILGNNMTKGNVNHVSDYFGLDTYDIESLITSGVGEGILLVGDTKIPLEFAPTILENEIIKGHYLEKMAAVSESQLNPTIQNLIKEHNFCLDSWSAGPAVQSWERTQVANAFGAGMVTAWIKPGCLPTNQTMDHFSTVLQIAGKLALLDVEDLKINNYEYADISFRIDDKTYAIEYERAGSHTEEQLIEKKIRMQSIYSVVVFVCSSTYYKRLSGWLGHDFVIKRGQDLQNYIDSIQ